MIRYRETSFNGSKIKRVFLAGSSSSGKTTLCRNLLSVNFFGKVDFIYYFHPDIHSESPIEDWSETIRTPTFVYGGLPSLQDLLNLTPNSLVIIDDLIEECINSKDIDYLFRVLSSKRRLNVVIMSQKYFIGQKYGLSIRNSSNYHILTRNADERTNIKVGALFDLKKEISLAQKLNSKILYPYILIDRTAEARVSNCQVFIDFLGQFKRVICGSMVYYLISDQDFSKFFEKIDNTHAILKNGTSNKEKEVSTGPKQESRSKESNGNETDNRESNQPSAESKRSNRAFDRRRNVERAVRKVISRYRFHGKL